MNAPSNLTPLVIRIVELIPGLKVMEAHGRHDDLEDRIDYFSSGQVKDFTSHLFFMHIISRVIPFIRILFIVLSNVYESYHCQSIDCTSCIIPRQLFFLLNLVYYTDDDVIFDDV